MRPDVAGCECPRRIRRLRAVGRRGRACEQCTAAVVHCPSWAPHRVEPIEPAAVAEFRHTRVSALSRVDRVRFWGVAALWLAVNLAFWGWWLRQTQHSTPWLYWTETITLFYQTTLLPTVFWRFVRKMKRPVEVRPPADMRVAMITLCVPSSESLDHCGSATERPALRRTVSRYSSGRTCTCASMRRAISPRKSPRRGRARHWRARSAAAGTTPRSRRAGAR